MLKHSKKIDFSTIISQSQDIDKNCSHINPSLNIDYQKENSKNFTHKGYLYLLFVPNDEGLYCVKPGKTEQGIKEILNSYKSRGTKYRFLAGYQTHYFLNEFQKKQDLASLEKQLISKINSITKNNSVYGNEHFLCNKKQLDLIFQEFFVNKKESNPKLYKSFNNNAYSFYLQSNDFIFPAPKKCAINTVSLMKQGDRCILIDSENKCQVGKTGVINCTGMEAYLQHQEIYKNSLCESKVPQIFTILGISDIDLKFQSNIRSPILQDNFLKTGNPLIYTEIYQNLNKIYIDPDKETILFLDESHAGHPLYGKIDSFLKEKFNVDLSMMYEFQKNYNIVEARKKWNEYLRERKVTIIFVSATDFYTRYHITNSLVKSVSLKPGKNHTCYQKLFNKNLLKDPFPLLDKDNNELSDQAIKYLDFRIKERKYGIIRSSHKYEGQIANSLKNHYGEQIKVLYFNSNLKELEPALLNHEPDVFTVILIKRCWSAGKTLHKQFLSFVYETISLSRKKPSLATVLQGLLGRVQGYDFNPSIDIFVDVDLVARFINKQLEHKQKADARSCYVNETDNGSKEFICVAHDVKYFDSNEEFNSFKKEFEKSTGLYLSKGSNNAGLVITRLLQDNNPKLYNQLELAKEKYGEKSLQYKKVNQKKLAWVKLQFAESIDPYFCNKIDNNDTDDLESLRDTELSTNLFVHKDKAYYIDYKKFYKIFVPKKNPDYQKTSVQVSDLGYVGDKHKIISNKKAS